MSDGLSWATAIDTTGFEQGAAKIEADMQQVVGNVEAESSRIQAILDDMSDRAVILDIQSNMPQTAEDFQQALQSIQTAAADNQWAIDALSQEYNELTANINKFQNVPSKRDEVAKWKQERQAIKENINIRKELIAKCGELTTQLKAQEKQISKQSTTHQSLRSRIKEVKEEMALLRIEAEKNGQTIDESTGRYRELADQLGALTDVQGDVATQAKILSNDQGQFQGIISGLTGMSGAFSAAQGAAALFGSENENLQKVMTQLQAVMAITMGLQQVSQMLNKDSAFTLVTLNSLRKLWNKLIGESNTAQAANNAITQQGVVATEEQASATTAETTAEVTNTTAQQANSKATTGGAVAKTEEAAATEADTVAQNAHTGAMVAGTVATKAMAVAMRVLKLALISTGIGALIVLVGELVSWITDLCTKEDEAVAKAKEVQECNNEGAKAYAKASAEIKSYINRIDNFKGTAKEEKQLLKEVNDKFGEQMDYAQNLGDAKDILVRKGEAYCNALAAEARAQAYLNKYVEAYINLLQVQEDIKSGKYHHWYNTKLGDQKADEEAENKAQADADRYLEAYQNAMLEAQQIRSDADLGNFTAPSSNKPSGSPANKFDPKAAAREQKQAIEQWKEAMKQYITNANKEVAQANIDSMADGMAKEIAAIQNQTKQKKKEWENHILQLATARKAAEKAYYLSQKGHTEEGWEASTRGKMSTYDYANEILQNPQNAELANQYWARLSQITEQGNQAVADIQKKYRDKWIKDYGTDEQKAQQFEDEWTARLKQVMEEAPELYDQVYDAYTKAKNALDLDKFKLSINWDDVFGDLENQSLQSLQVTLAKVKKHFEETKDSMSVTEIKDYQEAITKMEDEIASRNPFTAMHKAFRDISTSKTELVNAMAEMSAAQTELNAATSEYNALTSEKNRLLEITRKSDQNDEIFALQEAQKQLITSENALAQAKAHRAEIEAQIAAGNPPEDANALAEAINAETEAQNGYNEALQARNEAQSAVSDQDAANAAIQLAGVNNKLEASTTRLAAANKRNGEAESRVLTARNNVTKSYKQFATQLKSCGTVVTGLGGQASKLARVFSSDIADSIDKALGFMDEVLDATSSVISAVGDVGKSVAKGMTQTVDSMGQATKSTAQATATSISTVEKASIILTVISAALQIATAIANLFNNDDKKQKEIERLQERIDQLQWELDNADAVRLQNNTANTLEKLKQLYAETTTEVLRLHGVTAQSSSWVKWFARARYEGEIYSKTIEKIADYWASAGYMADKALGSKKYEEGRKQLENLAEQQLLVQKQMNEEASKKDSDSGKIQDYKNQIAELAEEMATIINDMLEDIIGTSAEDLSKTLGDAFFDAAAAGEDAMEAWHKKTNEIVADIIKRMLITKYLEPEIGKIFDKYRTQWFGSDGRFRGIDAVINSADNLANDINQVGANFNTIWQGLESSLDKWIADDEAREGTSRGIATASQDSVDENNARLTTIQGHTYTLVQGVSELNATANAMLDRLTGIEDNTGQTNEKLDTLDNRVKRVSDTLEIIQTSGLRLKN